MSLASLTESETPTAPPIYIEQTVPQKHIATSLLGLGPIPLRWITAVLALVAEQWRVGMRRSADRLTNLEALAVSRGIAGAERIRDEGAAKLTRIAEQFDKVRTELATTRAALAEIAQTPVTEVHGGLCTTKESEERLVTVQAVVTAESDDGSLMHRRVPDWLRRLVPWATALDLPVLMYFIGEVFNVDFAGLVSGDTEALGQSIIPLLTTFAFALLGTAVVAIGLQFFARDVRGYKDDEGHPDLPEGKRKLIPAVFLGVAITVAIGAGVVMAYRIVSDSLAAGNGGLGATILGLFFAVVVVMLNVVVFSAHYRDGSTDTEELDHLAGQLRPVRAEQLRLQKKLDELTPQLTELRQAATRVYDDTLTKMSPPLKAADQLRLLARSYHQGCGWEAELVVPLGNPPHGLLLPRIAVDTSVLDTLVQSLRTEPTSAVVPAVIAKGVRP